MCKERTRPLPRTPACSSPATSRCSACRSPGLSGILLPLSHGPAWLCVPGHLNPMYYAVRTSRDLAAGITGDATVGVGFAVTAAAAALPAWWGTRAYQRAMK